MGMLAPEGEVQAPVAPTARPESTPTASPSEPEQGALGDEVSEGAIVALDEATQIAYSEDLFPKIVAMFEKGGAEGFPDAMGSAVLGVMQKLESEQDEPLSEEVLAEVGANVFEMLLEDIVGSGKVEGVTPQVLTAAVQKSIQMWAKANPDRFDPQVFEQEAMAALEESGEMPPVTPNPEQRNMIPEQPGQAAPQGGMLMGGA